MDPVDFRFRNMLLPAPAGAESWCQPLPVWHDGKAFMSVWKLSDEDKKRIEETGLVYVVVYGGVHPPISLHSESIIEETLSFNVGDQIFCKIFIPGRQELVDFNGVIELRDGTYFINSGKNIVPMGYAREVTIIPSVD